MRKEEVQDKSDKAIFLLFDMKHIQWQSDSIFVK